MNEMLSKLTAQLDALFHGNPILSTVAGGSAIVWLVTNLKNMWRRLVGFVESCISFTVVNSYEDSRGTGHPMTDAQLAFNDIVAESRPIWSRNCYLDLSDDHTIRFDSSTGRITGSTRQHNLAYGSSIRILCGKLVVVNRSIEKGLKITCTTAIQVFFGFRRKFMARLNEEIEKRVVEMKKAQTAKNVVRVYNGRSESGEKTKRGMDSIFTKDDIHYKLLDSIKTFIGNKPLYEKLAYPHTYSALLYGEPGCGKTSTILAIASELNRNIEYVNLSRTDASGLLNRINNARGDILVFEDIDALNTGVAENRDRSHGGMHGHAKDDPSVEGVRDEAALSICEVEKVPHDSSNPFGSLHGISLSDILNITDGLLASDDTICLFTTNHIEKLDPAFLRAGRMNFLVEFTQLDAPTASKMLKANLGWDVPPSALKNRINPAELQETILHVALGKAAREDVEAKFFIKSGAEMGSNGGEEHEGN